MTTTQKELFDALSVALFSGGQVTLSEGAKQEALDQAVYSLIADDVTAMKNVSKNMQIGWQHRVLNTALESAGIPFAVLKGLAAAQYYPEPMLRPLGDIDIIVAPQDFARAYAALKDNRYKTSEPPEGDSRHVHFKKDGVTIELHRRYASLNSRATEELLDSWIYDALPFVAMTTVDVFSFPALPEPLNGLTLLAHINQHLEDGLGIRQLIDWVMYVSRELSDEQWPAFKSLTDQLGLTKLAKYIARFGQLYLGLPTENYHWCMDVDDRVCEELADYAFACGNFGQKDGTSNTVTKVLSHGSGLRAFFRNLQNRGESNWKAYQSHRWLKPFCWMYQAIRYARLGLRRDNALANLKTEYASSQKRNALMRALGASRLAEKQ